MISDEAGLHVGSNRCRQYLFVWATGCVVYLMCFVIDLGEAIESEESIMVVLMGLMLHGW